MKVARVGEVIEIEIVPPQLRDRSCIRKNVAPLRVMEDHGDARCGCPWNDADLGDIDSAFLQPLQRNPAQRIVSNARLKSYPAAECRKIMRDDC